LTERIIMLLVNVLMCDIERGSAVAKCLTSHGDLKLAFVITKGQFELDVICAKELIICSSCSGSRSSNVTTTITTTTTHYLY